MKSSTLFSCDSFPACADRVRLAVPAADSRWGYLCGKRLFDIAVSAPALVLSLPLLLLVALWVRLDSPGPAFYRQLRRGRNGVDFHLFKLRTMSVEAESVSGPVWATVGDARVTRAGRILRKLYLDEIPQLLNILAGQMSFVGPRPERPYFYRQLERDIPGFSRRLAVRPGLTGLAQVRQSHKACLIATRRKSTYDQFYIARRSFGLDLLILWRTFRLLVAECREVWR